MYGYLFYPKNAKQGSHPVVLTPPGAGIKTIKEPLRNKYHQILQNKDCLNTLAYYDVVNFARYVKAPTYLIWGYNDVTCPPTTSYAVWNTLKCEEESLVTPINEHWASDETKRKQMVWIKEHLVK